MNNINNITIIVLILILIIFSLSNNLRQHFSNKKNLTIVTAYFKVNRTRNIEYTNGRKIMPKDSDGIYKEWMKGLLSYHGPMVIYTDNDTYEYIKKLRINYPETKIIKMEINNLPTYKFFKKNDNNKKNYATMIWKEHNDKDINKKLYTIWSSKIPLLKKTIRENPFNTFYFTWFDIGYIRDKNKQLEIGWPSKTKLKILDEKVLFNIVYGGPSCKDGGTTTGGFIGCNKNNINKFNDIFIDKIKKRIQNNKLGGDDQIIYNELRCEYPDLIHGIKGIKSDYWDNVPHDEWFYIIPYFYNKIFKKIEKFINYNI